jgi:AraC-like DNA-binding protein
VVLLASAAYSFLPVIGLREYLDYVFVLGLVVLFFFISIVVWKGLKQPELFSGIELQTSEKKTAWPLINESERRLIREKVEEVMRSQRPFLDPDLSLDQLAQTVNTTPKKLSHCINEEFGQNFFDYINSARIIEAQRIFREAKDPGITVLEVMYQCGFNSKSSFNTIFKQKTGLTPSAFKKGAVNS